jgi:hypothetical protein
VIPTPVLLALAMQLPLLVVFLVLMVLLLAIQFPLVWC